MNQGTVAVLGASNKPERYSNKAIKLLKSNHWDVLPIHPRLEEIEGLKVLPSLRDVKDTVHTLTVYVGPARIRALIADIVELNPDRVLLNPGTESAELMRALEEAQIPYLQACTLVLLNTGQF